MADCVAKVMEKFPEADRKDLQDLYDSMDKERRDALMEGLGNPDSEFALKAELRLEQYKNMVRRGELEAKQNLFKRATEEAKIDAANGGRAAGMKLLAGDVDGRQKGALLLIGKAFLKDIADIPGAAKVWLDRSLSKEIFLEAENRASGGTKPVTESDLAYQIGGAIQKLNQSKLKLLNDSGANIHDLNGYVVFQSHDWESIKALGDTDQVRFEKWMESILPRLDHDKTFFRGFYKNDPREYLQSIFNDIRDGKGKILQSSGSDNFTKIIGTPSNMARRAELGRKLFFKPGEYWEYSQEFGKKSFEEQTMASIRSTARTAGFMQKLGTNPKATWEGWQGAMDQRQKDSLSNFMRELDGTASIPGENPLAKWASGARQVVQMAKMGLSLPSHFNTLMTRATLMKTISGDNLLSLHLKSLKSMLENLPESSRMEAMRITGLGADTRLGHMASELFSSEAKPGIIQKANETFFKLNGMHHFIEASRAGTAMDIAGELGGQAGKSFSSLSENLGRTLQRYGIGPVEWELMRNGVETAGEHGPVLGYGHVRDLPNDFVEGMMRKGGLIKDGAKPGEVKVAVNSFKTEAATKMAHMFQDRVDISMSTPGIFERANFLRRGTLAGTVGGEALRSAAMFKSYPLSMVTRFGNMVVSEIMPHQTAFEKVGTITGMGTSAMLLGYTALAVKEMLQNKSPPDPFDHRTAMRAAVQGGVMGIYGDYLMGEYDKRQGRSMLSAVAGPIIGQLDDLNDIKQRLMEPEKPGGKSRMEKTMAQTWRVILNNTPGQNYPIVKPAMEKLILDDIAERLNHGYLSRREEKMKEHGQHSIFGH